MAARGHAVLTDQPAITGGEDAAMTPTDLLVASFSSYDAFYAGRYLARHELNRDGLQVTTEFTMAADRPARVGPMKLKSGCPMASRPAAESPCSPWGRTAPCTTRFGTHLTWAIDLT